MASGYASICLHQGVRALRIVEALAEKSEEKESIQQSLARAVARSRSSATASQRSPDIASRHGLTSHQRPPRRRVEVQSAKDCRSQAFARATCSRCGISMNSSPFRIASSAASLRIVDMAPVSPPLISRTNWTISRRARFDGFCSGRTFSNAAIRLRRFSLFHSRKFSRRRVCEDTGRWGISNSNIVAAISSFSRGGRTPWPASRRDAVPHLSRSSAESCPACHGGTSWRTH